jgi:hypothetical protein
VDYEVDIGEINERWSREATVDVWSQIIIKETRDQVELLTEAPRTGIYRLGQDEAVTFRRWGNDWHGIFSESEAFYLRIVGPGDYLPGRGSRGAGDPVARPTTAAGAMQQWITGMRGQFASTPPAARRVAPASPLDFKMA